MDGDAVNLWFTLDRHDILDKPTSTLNASMEDAEKLRSALAGKLTSAISDLDKWDQYYRGTQPLSFLHPEIALTVGDRLKSMVVNWCRVALDSLEERLNVEGFRLGDAQTIDMQIAQTWQQNDFDLGSGRTHHASLRHGRGFVSVWTGDKGAKLAVESARQTTVSYEPGTMIVNAALKKWQAGSTSHANLYLPDRTVKYSQGPGTQAAPVSSQQGWQVTSTVPNPLGIVPVVPFLNRYDLDMPDGESELADIAPLVDAINKLATDMMVSSEFHAMPRRWATGIEIQQGEGGKRTQEEAKAYWERATAGKVWLAGEGVNFGQFAAADLKNFNDSIDMLTAKLAAIASLPPHYMGLQTNNPASADAIRSAEAALIKKAQRKQRALGEAWEDTITLAMLVENGEVPDQIATLETVWGDPATPTVAQAADAAMKLLSVGITDVEQALEDLGYTANQIERMRVRRASAVAEQMSAEMRARVSAALDLCKEFGIDPKIAFAAVGLDQPPKGAAPGPAAPPPVPIEET
jgi:hypothetical protein